MSWLHSFVADFFLVTLLTLILLHCIFSVVNDLCCENCMIAGSDVTCRVVGRISVNCVANTTCKYPYYSLLHNACIVCNTIEP